MISPRRLQYVLLLAISLLVFYNAYAQTIDEKAYQHKMRLMDSLSLYKMDDYDTLYQISVLYPSYGRDFRSTSYGWCNKWNEKKILFININGTEHDIDKKQIISINPLIINNSTMEAIIDSEKTQFPIGNFGKKYLLNLWLYKKGQFDFSKQMLPKNDKFFDDSYLRDDFGIVYYNAMLEAFTGDRDYPKAIKFGDHLTGSVFNGYQYQKAAIALTAQLKSNPEDFKTFRLPDSLEWSKLEQKLPRDQQIIYLADRLRLLNCIQLEQPGGISYDMSQFSISIKTASELNIRYWGHNAEYGVINPFLELLKMNLNPHETELLLPYLLSEDYIASYNYHRDFFPNRNLHKLSWVVNDLIYQITNQLFFKQDYFDSLTLDQKKAEVEKIKKWCDENAGLSREDMTIKTLKTTDQWIDFHKAMLTAKEEKYEALLPIIVDRFNDSQIDISRGFQLVFQPSNKGMMAETMFDIGNEKYIGAVRNWNKDTTDVWVNLFSSLFLLKYDKQSYEPAMNELESVLRQDDGTAYYPYAMDLLLSMSDKRALKLAEGILDKPQFARFMEWDYYLNFIKKLLLLKSDYTFNFISSKLDSFTPDEVAQFSQYGNTNMLMQSDFYVLAVDKLKQRNSPGYDPGKSIEIRSEYRKTLNKWFITQYNLLKEGKPNELQLNMVQVNRPQTFIDAAH